MSAGDPVILGSLGTGSGALGFTEQPRSGEVTYELIPSSYGINISKRLTRTFRGLKVDVKAFLQSLTVTDASLSAVAAGVNTAGAAQTVDYGGGWRLLRVGTPPINSTTCEVNLTYEKTVTSIFEFGLPTNITLTETGGVSTFRYKTTTLETITSGKGTTTSGLSVSVDFRPEYTIASPGVLYHRFVNTLLLYCDGVLMQSLTVNYKDYGFTLLPDPISGTADTWITSGDFYGIQQTLRWDTSVSNHVRLLFWDKILKDWDVTGL